TTHREDLDGSHLHRLSLHVMSVLMSLDWLAPRARPSGSVQRRELYSCTTFASPSASLARRALRSGLPEPCGRSTVVVNSCDAVPRVRRMGAITRADSRLGGGGVYRATT